LVIPFKNYGWWPELPSNMTPADFNIFLLHSI
jgi:hypothetical protein